MKNRSCYLLKVKKTIKNLRRFQSCVCLFLTSNITLIQYKWLFFFLKKSWRMRTLSARTFSKFFGGKI